MVFRVGELAVWLEAALEGDADKEIIAAASLETAGPTEISFVGNRKAAKQAQQSGAGCLVVPVDFENSASQTVLRVADARRAFARVIRRLHPAPSRVPGIHPTAVVASTATIGEGTSIGPHCTIGDGARLGRDCTLYAGVTLYEKVELGDRCILHSGCVLGADGFGFVFERDHFEKFPQVGKVVLGNDVEIGANSCVDRAALGITSIGDGTKLDNMVHVAHNCRIGRHVVIAAQTGMAGGTLIEDYAVIGGQVGLGDSVRIERGATLGSGSGVLSSKIVRQGETVWGTPARPLKEYLRNLAELARITELRGEVKELRKRLAELEAKPDPKKL
jgi:UDP-3-O-[3-hydroxymyristoyl] glucosamine N-acyltransferase